MRWNRTRSTALRPRSLLTQGLVVGVCATQALDWLSIVLYANEDPSLRASENAARGNLHAYERAVDRLARRVGIGLDDAQLRTWGWRFHKAFGVLGGLSYVAMRRANRRVGWGLGLAFGAAFFVLADEVLMPALRLTPGPRAFSWKVHARGAAAHVAYGVAAESAARALDAVTA